MAATLHAPKGYPGAALEHKPYVSTRARFELGLSPLSLSGSHAIAGSAVAMST